MGREIHYTKAQKAVAALVAIAKPHVSELMKQFTKEEVRKLLAVSKTMKAVAGTSLETIADEFETEFARSAGILDSGGQFEQIVSQSFDQAEMAAISGDTSNDGEEGRSGISVWHLLAEAEAGQIADFISSENDLIGSFILGRLEASQAANVLALTDRRLRAAILHGMLGQKDFNKEAEKFLETQLKNYFIKLDFSGKNSNHSNIANIINSYEVNQSEELLKDLNEVIDQKNMGMINSLIFRFQDIINLNLQDRIMVLDKIPIDLLTLALRGEREEMAEAALAAVSQRSRRIIENDLRSKQQIRPADIANAQKQIVAEVLRLSGEGRLEMRPDDLAAA